ncbi:class I SAM-dependent RNA methyltransferase [Iodidimonas nitroreducens]|nr:class I SAM-dependent RNA methyltransferase [Iodidimonas nitroreducens]
MTDKPKGRKSPSSKAAKSKASLSKGRPMRLRIERIGAQGDGIAQTGDGPIFVPFTLAGDEIDAWLEPGPRGTIRAQMEGLITPGPGRQDAPCRHHGQCGGCSLQHLDADLYARWVADRVQMAMAQHGLGDCPMAPPQISPPSSRRRLSLKAMRTSRGVLLGFAMRQSHHLVDVRQCPVARPSLVALFKPLRALLHDLMPLRAASVISLTEADNGIDMVIDGGIAPGLSMREALAAFAQSRDIASLHVMEDGLCDPVAVNRRVEMVFDGIPVPLPPGGFIQATAEGEAALRALMLEWLEGAQNCVDLFAGIGTFSFPLARRARVLAVEGARTALDALQSGVNKASHLKGLTALHRDLFRRPLSAAELAPFDGLIIDPPRAGAVAQMGEIAKSGVRTVVAFSCNPNSFARDARILVDGGYQLCQISPVDQFLWSPHVELAALFTKS